MTIGYYRAWDLVTRKNRPRRERESTPRADGPLMSDTSPDSRRIALSRWLDAHATAFGLDLGTLQPASSDASFRRYFRIASNRAEYPSVIVMDAPPQLEDCTPFVRVDRYLAGAGVSVPQLLAENVAEGFLLLSDLGRITYLSRLDRETAPSLYGDAFAALIRIQLLPDQLWLPRYNRERLYAELALFEQWYVVRHLGRSLSAEQKAGLAQVYERLILRHLAESTVTVHRDYHSRNLMVLEGPGAPPNPGIIDFQDAVRGPASYDAVSLLRDAYIEWPEERILDWAVRYWEQALKAGVALPTDFGEFWIDFEWMGLQRHLKVLGIFARLYHRDGKSGYLGDMPLVLRYAHSVARRYVALSPLARVFDALEGKLARQGYPF